MAEKSAPLTKKQAELWLDMVRRINRLEKWDLSKSQRLELHQITAKIVRLAQEVGFEGLPSIQRLTKELAEERKK